MHHQTNTRDRRRLAVQAGTSCPALLVIDGDASTRWSISSSDPQWLQVDRWTVSANGSLQALGKCLDINGAGAGDGTQVQLYTCNNSGAQVWQPQSDGSLLNPNSGKCLDDNNFGGSGTQAQIWTCNRSDAQKWTLP